MSLPETPSDPAPPILGPAGCRVFAEPVTHEPCLLVPETDMEANRLPGFGWAASKDANFGGAYFPRDCNEIAAQIQSAFPDALEEHILAAASYQGTKHNERTEEKPGKFAHEVRSLGLIAVAGLSPDVAAFAKQRLMKLNEIWGEETAPPEETAEEREQRLTQPMVYFGAAETFQGWLMAVHTFDTYHPERRILDQSLTHRTGEELTVREVMSRGFKYLAAELIASDLGMTEYRTTNPAGLLNQYLRDSATSLLFADGGLPNFRAPVAEIGVAGLTYDALKVGKELLSQQEMQDTMGDDYLLRFMNKARVREVCTDEEVGQWLLAAEQGTASAFDVLAKVQQRQVLKRFWMPEAQYFCSALDRDPTTGELRQVDSLASNPGDLLGSGIFDDLPDEAQCEIVSAIAEMLTGKEFWTDAGPRARALRHQNILQAPDHRHPLDEYFGSSVVFPILAAKIGNGFGRCGLFGVEQACARSLSNALNIMGSHQEFLRVDVQGRLLAQQISLDAVMASRIPVEVLCAEAEPEANQSFAMAAHFRARVKLAHEAGSHAYSTSWRHTLDRRILARIGASELLTTDEQLLMARRRCGAFALNVAEGRAQSTYYNNVVRSQLR